jgi:hypothetical protein
MSKVEVSTKKAWTLENENEYRHKTLYIQVSELTIRAFFRESLTNL